MWKIKKKKNMLYITLFVQFFIYLFTSWSLRCSWKTTTLKKIVIVQLLYWVCSRQFDYVRTWIMCESISSGQSTIPINGCYKCKLTASVCNVWKFDFVYAWDWSDRLTNCNQYKNVLISTNYFSFNQYNHL